MNFFIIFINKAKNINENKDDEMKIKIGGIVVLMKISHTKFNI